jgi:fibronectin-binding autotransporter adhesin
MKRNISFTPVMVLLATFAGFFAVLGLSTASVAAADLTWDGEGTDNNWSTVENWSGDTAPVNGDTVTFDLSTFSSNETLNNNITDLSLAGISVTGTGTGHIYEVTGNALTLTGPFSGAGDATNHVVLDLHVVFGANIDLTSEATGVRINGTNSTINTVNYSLTLSHDSNVYIKGVSGLGSLLINNGQLLIAPSTSLPSYSGTVMVGLGDLDIYGNSLPASATITSIGPGAIIINTGAATNVVSAPISIGGVATANIVTNEDDNANPIQLSGGLTLTSNVVGLLGVNLQVTGSYAPGSYTFTVDPLSTGTFTPPAEEPDPDPDPEPEPDSEEENEDTVTIGADDKSTATVVVGTNQTYVINGERGDTMVTNGGVLKGNGKVTTLVVQTGGTLAPGTSPGCITVSSGGLVLSGTYLVELAGSTVCTEYDQSVVTGAVDVSNGTLDLQLLNSFIPALNDTFIIINNDASDAVTGTFSGMADGHRFVVNGVTFEINYDGGDGNDVVLTAVSVPATSTPSAPDTGLKALIQNPIIGLLSVSMVGGLLFANKKYNFIK